MLKILYQTEKMSKFETNTLGSNQMYLILWGSWILLITISLRHIINMSTYLIHVTWTKIINKKNEFTLRTQTFPTCYASLTINITKNFYENVKKWKLIWNKLRAIRKILKTWEKNHKLKWKFKNILYRMG